jgi:hypothetical protein
LVLLSKNYLLLDAHVSNICKSAYLEIRRISSIRHLLTLESTKTLVCSFVLSKLDYCNSLLAGAPIYLIDKLQRVQNSAAKLVLKAKKHDHVQPLLKKLHWLPISHRISYKISSICFKSFADSLPPYLHNLLTVYTPARDLRSSSDSKTFCKPRVRTKTYGQRSFLYCGPANWSQLPTFIRHSASLPTFKISLKHTFSSKFTHSPFSDIHVITIKCELL